MDPATQINVAQAPAAATAPSLADYIELAKPRLNFLVLVTTAVGYYMAVRWPVDWLHLLHALVGTALTAAAASTLNQYAERRPDALMPRTANRPLPAGRVEPAHALGLGIALAAVGLAQLALLVNPLTALLGAITLLSYILLYTPMKRWTSLCTIVGAIPGAIPPVMGWTAVRNSLGPEALALFAILFIWQMPHFLAIAILYRRDYAAGGFRMLPVIDPDLSMTSRQIIIYCLCLLPVSLAPALMGMASAAYFAAAVALGLVFLKFGLSCASARTRPDARKLFIASIVYLPLLLAVLMMDKR